MSSSSNTPLSPPPTLPYPVRIEHIRAQAGLAVQRGDVLLRYRYFARDPDDKTIVESRIGTWECPVEGKIVKWKVRVGDEVTSSADALVDILEPCTHPVQLEGLCALCGKDLTGTDYLSYTPSNRANIQMSHESTGLLVSLEEASRLESLTSSQLITTRRLSLIVDLDQTIIHATVDPTVGDWMDECGLLGKEKGSDKKGKGRNPNEEALKDVGRFQLGNGDDCWYYIKPRPGLADFLSTLSEIYEMHVYTMGTRAYAERVCEVIDPEGNIFGRRILSRDENGSLTAKSLSRLFPVDTSMVVIIDDRSDVWSGSRNLVKVIPYDFFVGIGDINGTFLPKVSAPTSLLVAPPLSPSTSTASSAPSSPPLATLSPEPLLLPSSPTTAAELDEAQHHAIEDQIGERSLAKQQEELRVVAEKEKEKEREEVQVEGSNGDDSVKPAMDGGNVRGTALLNNDDRELARLESLLRKVHQDYYSAHDRLTKKKAVGSRHRKDLPSPDVKTIIDGLKADVFTGCSFVFSGVIPLGARPDSSEIWRSSRTFGAECESGLSHRTTHLIAKQPGTQKVHDALRPPYHQQVSIVHPAWIYDSIAHWTQLATTEYDLIPASTTPPGSPDKPNAASSSSSLPPTAAAATDVPEELIGEVELGEIDIWGQADKELEAFLEESDEDESEAEADGEDASEASRSNQPANGLDKKRKRLRTSSLPPSPLSEPTPSASDRSMLPSASSSTNGILSKRPRTDATTLVGSPLAESESVEPANTDRDRVEVDCDGEEGDGMGSGSGSDESDEDLEEWAKLLSAG